MQSTFKIEKTLSGIRKRLLFFMIMLALSGLTAIPVQWELAAARELVPDESDAGVFLQSVANALDDVSVHYPFLFYGYDWLAFAHVVLAIAFIGPYRDPVRNKWVVEFGMIACLLIVPVAIIGGYFRGIPFWWRMIDCSFGVIGIIPLLSCYKKIIAIERLQQKIQATW
jgi:hypothetical protein